MMWNDKNLIDVLKKGGVAVMPTDTLYGIVGQAQSVPTVNRIYNLKKRNPDKPCIILIGDIKQLSEFSIVLSSEQENKLKEYWSFGFAQDFQPSPTSIILDCPDDLFSYLHRGTKTLAFRLPALAGLTPPESLRDLLIKTGPLIAPSANPEGSSPAQNTIEAKEYFGDLVDLYIDGGLIEGKASKVIKLHKNGSVTILRE